MRLRIFVATLLVYLLVGVSGGARAQIATPGSTTVTQVITSNAVSAGSSQTATIAGVAGKFSCAQDVLVTLDVPTTGTVGVSGIVTISDGSWTVSLLCLDTFTSGAWCEYYGPVLQSSAVNTTITATVPAYTNGGAGRINITGYTNPGGC